MSLFFRICWLCVGILVGAHQADKSWQHSLNESGDIRSILRWVLKNASCAENVLSKSLTTVIKLAEDLHHSLCHSAGSCRCAAVTFSVKQWWMMQFDQHINLFDFGVWSYPRIATHQIVINVGFFCVCFTGGPFQWCADVLSCVQDRSMPQK